MRDLSHVAQSTKCPREVMLRAITTALLWNKIVYFFIYFFVNMKKIYLHNLQSLGLDKKINYVILCIYINEFSYIFTVLWFEE